MSFDGRFVDQARRDLTVARRDLTAERLRKRLRYAPESGFFYKNVPTPGRHIGKRAGWKGNHGRWTIELDGRSYLASRLAWLYMTGEWPSEDIDHINQDLTDDRFCNLREASRSQNLVNRSYANRNKAGFRGVHRYRGRWIAQIAFMGCKEHLGVFDTPEDAHRAYVSAARLLHGEFLPQAEIKL